jgi:NAD-dependent deacetylase
MSFASWIGEIQNGDPCYVSDYLNDNPCPPTGLQVELNIRFTELDSEILLPDAASWEVLELGMKQESFSHAGYQGTLFGLLNKVKFDINMMRSGYSTEIQLKIDAFINKIEGVLSGEQGVDSSLRFRIRDPSGLVSLVSLNDLDWNSSEPFHRSFDESVALGVVSDDYLPINSDHQLSSAEQVAKLLSSSHRVVCLSGAGISVESGIPPFRTSGGETGNAGSIWTTFDANKMTLFNFNHDTSVAEDWWRMKHFMFPLIHRAHPNPAHAFFGYLEQKEKLQGIITQNIDSLHHAGGVSPERIVELHGHMRGLICSNKRTPLNPIPYRDGSCSYSISDAEALEISYFKDSALPLCPICSLPLRTETVMFGQPLPEQLFHRAVEMVAACDVLVVVGSSLIVEPASTLPSIALRLRIPLIIVSLDSTQYDAYATGLIRHPAGLFFDEVRRQMDLAGNGHS